MYMFQAFELPALAALPSSAEGLRKLTGIAAHSGACEVYELEASEVDCTFWKFPTNPCGLAATCAWARQHFEALTG